MKFVQLLNEKWYKSIDGIDVFENPSAKEMQEILTGDGYVNGVVKLILSPNGKLYAFDPNVEHNKMAYRMKLPNVDSGYVSLIYFKDSKNLSVKYMNFKFEHIKTEKELKNIVKRIAKVYPMFNQTVKKIKVLRGDQKYSKDDVTYKPSELL